MTTLLLQEPELSDWDFQTISEIVYHYCGIHLGEDKKELVRSRLARRLRIKGHKRFSDYLDYILQNIGGEEFYSFIDSISTNFTSFFREKQHFDYLANNFLLSLISRKSKKGDYRIRAWSAGCSSGEEVYSMAIAMLDALGGDPRWDIKILATDISTWMLDTARRAIYDQKKIEPLNVTQRQKYLTIHDMDGQKYYEVKNNLRNIITIKHLNLMDIWPIRTPLDFIFCRNVMIYFDKTTQQNLISRFWDALDVNGILFTGHSESLAGITHSFKYVQPAVYKKSSSVKKCIKEEL